MPITTIDGHEIHVDDEGFLTDYDEWTEDLGDGARRPDRHRPDRRALEGDPLPARRLRRARARPRRCAGSSTVGGIPTKELFALFPQKPAKKMAYVAGLPKPRGCV